MFEELHVRSFGGGLNFATHPAALRDDEWTWSGGFVARHGYAEVMPYYRRISDGSWLPAGYHVIGAFQNNFDVGSGAPLVLLLAETASSGGAVKLYTMSTITGGGTQITRSGSGTAATADFFQHVSPAYLDGYMVIPCGVRLTALGGGAASLLRWNGGATYEVVNTALATAASAHLTEPLRAAMIRAFAGRLVCAYTDDTEAGYRGLRWSDAGSTLEWDPRVDNSADTATLTEITSGINGLEPIGTNSLGVFTRRAIYVLVPTGGIPAFTLQLLSTQGLRDYPAHPSAGTNPAARPLYHGALGVTPYGTVYRGSGDFYVQPGGESIGAAVFPYFARFDTSTTAYSEIRGFLWHARLGTCIIPAPVVDAARAEFFFYEPRNKAWARIVVTNDPTAIGLGYHVYLEDKEFVDPHAAGRHVVATPDGHVFGEDETLAPIADAFVDTRDFAFSEPSSDDYVDRVSVDWEPLTNATTDAVEVLALTREDLSRSQLGSAGLEEDLTSQFVSLGTLAANGGSELGNLALRGKYTRFRFQPSSGRVRIRGFSIRRRRASDVAT